MSHTVPSARASRAFTLVELLVVIGIIAVLISILLPSLNRARESAKSVQCLSNIRQITQATMMWASENKGLMPARGGFGLFRLDPYSGRFIQITNDSSPEIRAPADWIAWQRIRDEFDRFRVNTTPNLNITYSALAKYLGSTYVETATPLESLTANPKLDQVYRCPSDDFVSRPTAADTSHGYYRYSYAMNLAYANPVHNFPRLDGTSGPATFTNGERSDGNFTGKISSIKSPSMKVLFICQDEKTLNDGSFNPNPYAWATGIVDTIAARHSMQRKGARSLLYGGENEDVIGNAGFADGHGAKISRKDALRRVHSGNPNLDPAGF